ncbi:MULTISPECIES: hypothetical protein [Clostridium]|uniref:hypothetical protein n=1 Tax=Clostridium TaxID=1485 RepID=UPI000826AE01|nr:MULTISPECIES: hypothetical protein [Clostridium]PJI08308.1 hypothetical protein CUB90_10725 [Clostridium sp. CT7]
MAKNKKDVILENLISELAHDFDLNDKKLKRYVGRFNDLYSDGYRHEYSDITRVLFLIEKDEERDFLPEKIKNIEEQMGDTEAAKSVRKLWDHINLENIRLFELRKISKNAQDGLNSFGKQVNKINKEASKVQDDINKDIDGIHNDINKFNKKMESAQISYISILGIFSSITFGLFGGLNILSQIFSRVTNLKDHDAFLGIMVIGGFVVFAIFNLLNLLLYSIGRIVDKDLVSRKCDKFCTKEKCDCTWYKKMFVKYTHIVIPNISIIIFMAIFLIAYLLY